MKILHRYVITEFLAPFFYCVSTFVFMCILVDLFGHLDEILKLDIASGKLFSYYAAFVPVILVQTAPMAVLLSTIYVLGTFQRHREIVAMKASGLSAQRIVVPFLFLGLLVSAAIYAVNEKIVPKANLLIKEIRGETFDKEKKTQASQTVWDITMLGKGNRMYYARSFDVERQLLRELIILEHDENLRPRGKIMAKEAVWTEDGWSGKDVIDYRLSAAGVILGKPRVFDQRPLGISERPKEFLIKSEMQIELMNYRQLRNYTKELRRTNPAAAKRIAVELHQRLAFPLTSFVIILLGVPFALRAKQTGKFAGFGMAITLALLYYAFNASCIAIGKGQHLHPLLAGWLANAVFAGIGIHSIGKVAT